VRASKIHRDDCLFTHMWLHTDPIPAWQGNAGCSIANPVGPLGLENEIAQLIVVGDFADPLPDELLIDFDRLTHHIRGFE